MNSVSCTNSAKSKDVANAYNDLNDAINKLKTSLTPSTSTTATAPPSTSSLQNKQSDIVRIRQDLDEKLNELNNVDGYPSIQTSKFNLDYVTYMSLLFFLITLCIIIFINFTPTSFTTPII